MEGYVHSVETFGLVDGPGVRYVIFLQGCHLRCRYCHNPETWSCGKGEIYRPEDLLAKAWRYRTYWMKKNAEGMNGGITLSGGEPLLQMEFATEFFRLAKGKEVHTALDTAGEPYSEEKAFQNQFERLMEVTNLFLLDLKEIDPEKHRALTGKDNVNILQMARRLSERGKELWIRHVLVPGLTDDPEGLKRLRDFIGELKTVTRVEVLPYHTLGLFKWEKLGIPYTLKDFKTPSLIAILGTITINLLQP